MTNHLPVSHFDPYDKNVYFFGKMERDEAIRMLKNMDLGTFILRESSRSGDFSLSVREAFDGAHQVTNYLIEAKENEVGKTYYKIGEMTFQDIPTLIDYFRLNMLEKSCLVKPYPKQPILKVIGIYKFDGERASDLPFDRGETLDVIDKLEDDWWTAKNLLGMVGNIPRTYVKTYEEGDEITLLNPSNRSSSSGSFKRYSTNSMMSDLSEQRLSQDVDRLRLNQAPGVVRVIKDRIPSIYNREALKIKKGQFLNLKEILSNGFGFGTYYDDESKSGVFPLTHVEWTTPMMNGDSK